MSEKKKSEVKYLPQSIKIGCTTTLRDFEKIHWIAEADYDYIETNLSMLTEASEKETAAFAADLNGRYSVPCRKLPFSAVPQYAPYRSDNQRKPWSPTTLERAFSRAEKVGIRRYRSVPGAHAESRTVSPGGGSRAAA